MRGLELDERVELVLCEPQKAEALGAAYAQLDLAVLIEGDILKLTAVHDKGRIIDAL